MNLNKCIIIGRLTRNPEARQTSTGSPMTTFSVATNRILIAKDGSGARTEVPEYHSIVAFGSQAEACAKFLLKGQEVMVEGAISTREFTRKDGTQGKKTDILAHRVQFGTRPLGPREAQEAPPREPAVEYDRPEAPKPPEAGQGANSGGKKTVGGIEYPEEEINPDDIPF